MKGGKDMKKNLMIISFAFIFSFVILLTSTSFVSAEGCTCNTDCSVVEGCTGISGVCEKGGVPSCSSCACPNVNLGSVNTGLTPLIIRTDSGDVKVEPGQSIAAAKSATSVVSRASASSSGITTTKKSFFGDRKKVVRFGKSAERSSSLAGWTPVKAFDGSECFIQSSASPSKTGAVIKWWGDGRVVINADDSITFTTQG